MLVDTRRYYSGGVVLPAALVVAVHFVLYIIQENAHDPNYQSEYFPEDAFNGVMFVFVLVNTIIVLALCSPILLVDFSHKSKRVLFLWWFLLPGSWLLYLCWTGIDSLTSPGDHSDSAFFELSNSLPYMVGLIWSYIRYQRKLALLKEFLPEIEVITKEDRKIPQSHTPPPQRGGY